MTLCTKLIKKLSKEVKSDMFCYNKVGRMMTLWGAIEKTSTAIAILKKTRTKVVHKNVSYDKAKLQIRVFIMFTWEWVFPVQK